MGKGLIGMVPVLFLATCAHGGAYCDLADPMYFRGKVIQGMTEREQSQIVKHNELGEKLCKWKPGSG